MGAVDERKALARLTRATRNLTSGARFGASQPPPPEGEESAPPSPEPAGGEAQASETPPGQ